MASSSVNQNPYAVKKAAPDLYQRPLEDFDDFEPLLLQQELEHNNNNNNQNANENDNVDDNAAAEGEKQQENNATTASRAATTTAPMNVPLPLWKRLPSNVVSIGSAEILSVTEVVHHGPLYYVDRSVRTTGVLRGKHYHEETGEVSLALQDPFTTTTQKQAHAQMQTAKKARRISFGLTNHPTDATTTKGRGSNTSAVATTTRKRRPSLGMTGSRTTIPRTPGTTTKTPLGTPKSGLGATTPRTTTTTPSATTTTATITGLLQQQQYIPHSHGGTNNTTAVTPKFRTPGLTSHRKRSLSSITTPAHQHASNSITSLLAQEQHSTVWVVCDPQHVPVDTLSMGDLVTVCGLVQQVQVVHNDSTTTDDDSSSKNHCTSQQPPTTEIGGDHAQRHASKTTTATPAVRQLAKSIWDKQQRQHQQLCSSNTNHHWKEDDDDETNPSSSSRTTNPTNNNKTVPLYYYYIQARILRQDNGANLRLQQEALRLRRKHLLKTTFFRYATHPQQQYNDDDDNDDQQDGNIVLKNDTILPGCGPPPYSTANRKSMSFN